MSQHPEAPQPDGAPPPSWVGAPGYTPPPELPPHAPMPGAPPYPPEVELPPPPVGRPAARTGFGASLGAAAIWAVVNLVLIVAVDGLAPSAAALGRGIAVLAALAVLTATLVRYALRSRPQPFWVVVLVAAPVFWVLRALANLLV